ncbi:ester cyclase [Streptomyces sp. NPDC051776]|uniref:ester cyclase n=1 Tax=Streptomyces sp. NPDC051776 TaxID=3155414 RepID=UPI003440EF18
MTFVQIIDCKTSKFDDMNRLMDTWAEQTKGRRTATHAIVGRDRSDDDHYVEIVEFPSYEDAMRNSSLPETDRTFQEMVALCDELPVFTDLEVVREDELNKATVRRFFVEVATAGNLDAIDELFAWDYVDHDVMKEQDATVGSDVIRQDVAEWRQAFAFDFTLESQLAEGEEVATRWTWRGTHRGEFLGIPPTGKECVMTGVTVFRLREGRIEEGWWQFDILSLLRQLDAVEM